MPPPIRIAGLHEDAVTTSILGDAITSIVLRLSAQPDEAWVEAFHHEWALTNYPRKRSARVGAVRAADGTALRSGLVVAASPEDYVAHHKRHLEDAVLRAHDRVRQRLSRRDETLAQAAEAIREINRAYYGPDATADKGPMTNGSVIRLAV